MTEAGPCGIVTAPGHTPNLRAGAGRASRSRKKNVTFRLAVAAVPLTFSSAAGYATNSSFNMPQMQAVGDFNGDGLPDAVISDGSQPTVLRLLIGTGGGSFGWPINLNISGACVPNTAPTCATNTGRLIAVDVNADGNLDILTANNHSRNL